MKKIGLLIICTNKYIQFLSPLIESADKHFCTSQDVTYFVFTNQEVKLETNRKVVITEVKHRDWPWMTLGRYETFNRFKSIFDEMDYMFYCDVDMQFVGDVGDEILSDRVATQHPYYYGRRGTPETNSNSLAYVKPNEVMEYFAGGFNGGTKKEYLKMCEKLSSNINKDYKNNIIAIWHDESHLNRYFIDNKPTKILNPSYCCHETWYDCPFGRRLLALDKNHKEIRN